MTHDSVGCYNTLKLDAMNRLIPRVEVFLVGFWTANPACSSIYKTPDALRSAYLLYLVCVFLELGGSKSLPIKVEKP